MASAACDASTQACRRLCANVSPVVGTHTTLRTSVITPQPQPARENLAVRRSPPSHTARVPSRTDVRARAARARRMPPSRRSAVARGPCRGHYSNVSLHHRYVGHVTYLRNRSTARLRAFHNARIVRVSAREYRAPQLPRAILETSTARSPAPHPAFDVGKRWRDRDRRMIQRPTRATSRRVFFLTTTISSALCACLAAVRRIVSIMSI